MKEITIGANDAGQRLDKFLTKAYPNLPQSMLYKSIRKKDIKLNGKRCEISTRLQEGDRLTMYLKDEFFQTVPKEYDFLKAPTRLSIVYEDENLLLLDKQPGLIVHPDETYHFDSLIARVQHYLYDKGEYKPDDEASFAPALINRIDRNTGGIVMAAKNAETLRIMNQKVRDRELVKLYLCIACGHMEKREATLTGYLEKNESQNRVYISQKPSPGQKASRRATACCRKRSGSACSRWSCSRGARTRSARTWLPSATRWPGTGNTAPMRSTGKPASAIRRCAPTSCASASPRRPAFWNRSTGRNSRPETCGS